mgnify:CR=1 FL=1
MTSICAVSRHKCVWCVARDLLVAVLPYGTALCVASRRGWGVMMHHIHVWPVTTARMNATMATNGLVNDLMQSCHCWWRRLKRRCWKVSRLFVVHSSIAFSRCQCALCSTCFLDCACSMSTVGGGGANNASATYVFCSQLICPLLVRDVDVCGV